MLGFPIVTFNKSAVYGYLHGFAQKVSFRGEVSLLSMPLCGSDYAALRAKNGKAKPKP